MANMWYNSSNSTFSTVPATGPIYSLSTDPAIRSYYLIVVPVLIVLCFIAVLGNIYILACIPWIRKSTMTVNLILSLGLAGADAWAATLVLFGLLVNSYLPVVHGITLGLSAVCYFLALELVRLSAILTSNLHLLILALNHWFSIVSPLRYKKMVTMEWCRTVIITLWIAPFPILFFTILGIRGRNGNGNGRDWWCDIEFYFHFPFRLIIFLHFVLPLLAMLAVYGYILHRIARVHNTNTNLETSRRALVSKRLSRSRSNASNEDNEKKTVLEMRVNSRSNVSQSKVKALRTTLLILGTFGIGWFPAVVQFTLVCIDCLIQFDPARYSFFAIGVVVNILIIIKLFINPLIYAFRILEIRFALWHMHVTRLGIRKIPINIIVPEEFKNLDQRRRSQLTSTLSAKSRRRERRHLNSQYNACHDEQLGNEGRNVCV